MESWNSLHLKELHQDSIRRIPGVQQNSLVVVVKVDDKWEVVVSVGTEFEVAMCENGKWS